MRTHRDRGPGRRTHLPRMVRGGRAAGPCGGRPAASCGIFDRVPGHPDKGMKPAVGEVLEALNLLEAGPLTLDRGLWSAAAAASGPAVRPAAWIELRIRC